MTPADEHHAGNCAAGSPNERAGPLFGLATQESVHEGSYDGIAAVRRPLGYARQSTARSVSHQRRWREWGVLQHVVQVCDGCAGHRETATTAWPRTRAVPRR
jgi:hypothetical protein